MRVRLGVGALIGLVACFWGTGSAQVPELLVIEGGTLIDGNGGEPVRDALVIIRGNRIETVSQKGRVSYPATARILRADGKFILPGLMDAHVHYDDYMAEMMLNHGVTSVFEIGGGGASGLIRREAINRGKILGPRQFLAVGSLAGARIAEQGGRSTLEGPLMSRRVTTSAEAAREATRRFIEAGADMIKVHRGPPIEVYRSAVEEAKKARLPVVAQPLGPTVYAKEAVLAGVDVLEHAAGVGYSIAKDPSKWKDWGGIEAHSIDPTIYVDMDADKAGEMIRLLIDRHVYLEPDFVCKGRGIFSKRDKFELLDSRLLREPGLVYLPERQRIKWLRNYVEFDEMEPAARERRVTGFQNYMRFIGQFARAGGKVLAGTDTRGWAVPGISLHHELELLVDAGLTPMQTLQAATRNTAEAFRILDRLGTVEPGKLADVVVLDADPLTDIANVREINSVVHDGKVLERGYHAWYKPPFPASGVQSLNWYSALKQQTMNWDPYWAFGWPPPGIESLSPTVITQGDETLMLTIKGVNFVNKSLIYFEATVVPTQLVSETELRATIGRDLLERAGSYRIVVKNPEPLQRTEWGDGTSNPAYLLVNFRY